MNRSPTLDSLLLSRDELCVAHQSVREMAYYNWLNAGCPDDRSLQNWTEAELRWIEYFYVPHRESVATPE